MSSMTARFPRMSRVSSLLVGALLALGGTPHTADAQRLADLSQAVSTIHRPALQHADSLTLATDPSRLLAQSGDRASHIRRGALWGAMIYAVFAAGYVVHEAATCDGPGCFGEGYAWIGLVTGFPVAIGVGAAIGAVWRVGS